MIKRLLLGISASVLLMASAAHSAPLVAESENIVLYGDVSPQRAKATVQKMEIYRKLIMTLSGVKPTADKQKLTIYAFNSIPELAKFTGTRGIAGLYTHGFDGPIMLTPLAGENQQDSFNNHVALHEYSHHVLHGYMDIAYPRWYDEGSANYLATFLLKDDVIQIGRVVGDDAETLLRGRFKWVDVEDVIGAIRVYPFADKGSKRGWMLNQFYAQSWLYVHYIHSNAELSGRLGQYLELVNSGEEPIKSFEKGFGVSVKAFDKAAKKYLMDNKFAIQQFQPGPEFMGVKVMRKKLTKPQLAMKMALGQRSFLNERTLGSYGKRLNLYESETGQTAKSLAARASYFISEDDYEQALAHSQSALAKDPTGIEPLRMMGDAYFHKSHEKEFKELEDTDPRQYTLNDDMKQSIRYFESALKQDDEDFTSVSHMMSIYGASDIPITPAARNAALTYEELYWDANSVTGTLNLSNIFIQSGNTSEACEYFQTAKKQAENDPNKGKSSLYNRVKLMEPKFSDKCDLSYG